MATDQRLKTALRQLVGVPDEGATTLPPPPVRPPIPAGQGVGSLKPRQTSAGQGEAIASLTEIDATARTFHPDRAITTSDGVFSIGYKRLHSTDMLTDTGATFPLSFGDPDA